MKRCNQCGQDKIDSEFGYRNRLFGTRQSTCKTCAVDNRKQSASNARDFVDHYLAERYCSRCGEYDPTVLTFHHIRGKKKDNVSNMVMKGYSIQTIQREIAKCEVVCYNCHVKIEKEARASTSWPNPNTPTNANYKQHGEYPRWFQDNQAKREELTREEKRKKWRGW